MVLLHPGIWGGPWNTVIPVFWVSVYLFGFTLAGRWMMRDGDPLDAFAVALMWPLVAVLFCAGKVLGWLFS